MNMPSHLTFRIATLVFAAFLCVQSTWLVLAELSRPNIKGLPGDAQAAVAAAKRRVDATWAAWIGGIRGDLWAESAFTYADLLWITPGADSDPTSILAHARARLYRAVDYAPHQADAWVLLAGLAARYQWSDVDAVEALKMSYYTGPNDEDLMPVRLRVAAHSEAFDDVEMQQFVRRDLRLLLASQRKSAVAEAYDEASPAGKRFIEGAVREIDPSSLSSLHIAAKKP
jgi:hypothetical protein